MQDVEPVGMAGAVGDKGLDPAAIDIRDAQLGPDPCLVDTLTLAQNGPENARNSHAEEHLHR
ncbi:hypothetical protein GCM10010980_24490 [Corynebacterium marinum]|nr:hypothetical protein GCM10010980_24490 [Corynebacterium marinum]